VSGVCWCSGTERAVQVARCVEQCVHKFKSRSHHGVRSCVRSVARTYEPSQAFGKRWLAWRVRKRVGDGAGLQGWDQCAFTLQGNWWCKSWVVGASNTPTKNAHCPSYCVRPNWLLYSGQDITLLFAGCCTDEKAPRLPCRMCSSPLRTAQPIDFLCHICSRLALFTVRQQQMAFTAMKPPP
jgi:hypothetical protein